MKRKIILIPIIILELLSILYLKDTYRTKQILWVILGIVLMFITSHIDKKHLKLISISSYIICIILLIICLFMPNTNGSHGWINLKYFSIQPSEFMKVSLVLISMYLSKFKKKRKFLIILVYLIPSILTFLEPDTGAVIIYILIFLCFTNDFYRKKEIILGITSIIILVSLCIYLYLYQRGIFIKIFNTSMYYRIDRLVNFKDESNIQITNALISIASGKLLYFPEANNDFFFSYLVCLNDINFFIIIISYLLIIGILLFNDEKISKILSVILSFQVVENIGMNLNLLPVIGIPLPFLSYGGSHTICYFLLLGLYLSNNNHNKNCYKSRVDKDIGDNSYN